MAAINECVAKIKEYLRSFPRFRLVDAHDAGKNIALTGCVLEHEHKEQAHEYACRVWPDILNNIDVWVGALFLYLLLFDAVIFGLAYWASHLVPETEYVLELIHHFSSYVVLVGLLYHNIRVVLRNVLR
jgi:hypothetical protein